MVVPHKVHFMLGYWHFGTTYELKLKTFISTRITLQYFMSYLQIIGLIKYKCQKWYLWISKSVEYQFIYHSQYKLLYIEKMIELSYGTLFHSIFGMQSTLTSNYKMFHNITMYEM
jgi:hypothetical protein